MSSIFAEIIQVPKPSMIGSLYICDRCIESHHCLDPCIYVLRLQYGIESVTSKILEWSVKTTGLQPAINATIQHLARSAYLPRLRSDMLFNGNQNHSQQNSKVKIVLTYYSSHRLVYGVVRNCFLQVKYSYYKRKVWDILTVSCTFEMNGY